MRKKIDDMIVYSIECLPEHVEVRGNALASGDDVEDKRVEDMIIDDLNNGNPWAWCTIKVTASIPGIDLDGTDYLGCCSYRSEEDFKVQGGYYPDMCNQAKNELINQLKKLKHFTKGFNI